MAAVLAGLATRDHPESGHHLVKGLIDRCRFIPVPLDDIERLALWCRDHTPGTARFIGPPGPKTFRLWSRRSLAFNRAASPYHAAGLADWFARFQEHVDFHGPPAEFVRLSGRPPSLRGPVSGRSATPSGPHWPSGRERRTSWPRRRAMTCPLATRRGVQLPWSWSTSREGSPSIASDRPKGPSAIGNAGDG